MKPKFKHDCDCCSFLGHHEEHDLYFCTQGGTVPTVIARWDDYGPAYSSGLSFARRIPILGEAGRRAVEKGHITQKEFNFWTLEG